METDTSQKKDEWLKLPFDWVFQARAKMAEDRSVGLEDSVASEMIKQMPREKICEITSCFQDRFMVLEDATSSWRIVKLYACGSLMQHRRKG